MKDLTQLSPEALNRIAREAWDEAARDSLERGLSVVRLEKGALVRIWRDGRRAPLERLHSLNKAG